MELQDFIKHTTAAIEQALDTLIPKAMTTPHASIFEAARYSLLNGGKRLRPLIAIATAQSFGANLEKALLPACAIEVLHTYSLIHDDLPCMDNDEIRRGIPTLHKVFGEASALLTGDYLLTLSFSIISKSPHLRAGQKLKLIDTLSSHAGADGMVGGQVVDCLLENQILDWKTLEFIHLHKTASLITAAFDFGAIIACIPNKQRKIIQKIGREIGLAFQIVDDILDVVSTKEVLGKSCNADAANGKCTAVTVLGVEKAQKLSQELFHSALRYLHQLHLSSPFIEDLLKKCVERVY